MVKTVQVKKSAVIIMARIADQTLNAGESSNTPSNSVERVYTPYTQR